MRVGMRVENGLELARAVSKLVCFERCDEDLNDECCFDYFELVGGDSCMYLVGETFISVDQFFESKAAAGAFCDDVLIIDNLLRDVLLVDGLSQDEVSALADHVGFTLPVGWTKLIKKWVAKRDPCIPAQVSISDFAAAESAYAAAYASYVERRLSAITDAGEGLRPAQHATC
tara:strand:- start:499 stop:1017 length:519 start_codon:yes stop_codon:yes gene_type:complete